MNKYTSLFLSFLLSLSLTQPAYAVRPAGAAGSWYADVLGITWVLTLKEDGTYESLLSTAPDAPENGSWELQDDRVILDGSESGDALAYDGTSLHITADGMDITFSRDPESVFLPAEAKTGADARDYEGLWHAEKVSSLGVTVGAAEAGEDLTAEISGLQAALHSDSLELEDMVLAGTAENGSLTFTVLREEPETAAETEEADTESGAAGTETGEAETTESETAGSETTAGETSADESSAAEISESETTADGTSADESSAAETTAASEVAALTLSMQLLEDGTMACTVMNDGSKMIFYMIKEEVLEETEEAVQEASEAVENVVEEVKEEIQE